MDQPCNVKLTPCHLRCSGNIMFAIQPFFVVQDLVEPNHDPLSYHNHNQTHHNLQTPCQNHYAMVEEIATKDFIPKAGKGEEGEVEKHSPSYKKVIPDNLFQNRHQHHPPSPTHSSTSYHHHHRSLCLQRQGFGHCFQTKTE